jgi:hypothetical protein
MARLALAGDHLGRGPRTNRCGNPSRPGDSAVDGRTTRHARYAISQAKRKRIEESFRWRKTIALLRKVRHPGLSQAGWIFTFAAAAYNLVRLRNLLASPVGTA